LCRWMWHILKDYAILVSSYKFSSTFFEKLSKFIIYCSSGISILVLLIFALEPIQPFTPDESRELAHVSRIATEAFELVDSDPTSAFVAIVVADRECSKAIVKFPENPLLRGISAECAHNQAVVAYQRGELGDAEKSAALAVKRYEHSLRIEENAMLRKEYNTLRLLQCAVQIGQAKSRAQTDRNAADAILITTIDLLETLPDGTTGTTDRQGLLTLARQARIDLQVIDPKQILADIGKFFNRGLACIETDPLSAAPAFQEAERLCLEALTKTPDNATIRLIAAECAHNLALLAFHRDDYDTVENYVAKAIPQFEETLKLQETRAARQEYDQSRLLQCAILLVRAAQRSETDPKGAVASLRQTIDRLENLPDAPVGTIDRKKLIEGAQQILRDLTAPSPPVDIPKNRAS
ncbi:MAG: hypothetical protein AB7I30_22110, partial [Isosphaeraceae bacterium]